MSFSTFIPPKISNGDALGVHCFEIVGDIRPLESLKCPILNLQGFIQTPNYSDYEPSLPTQEETAEHLRLHHLYR